MCYSAEVWASYKEFVRRHGADIDIRTFVELYGARTVDPSIKLPKAMDAAFADAQSGGELEIRALIDLYRAQRVTDLQQELFKQRKRLADAERVLKTKTTKKALDDRRIARSKVEQLLGHLGDLDRTDLLPRDSRIFPGHYVPVMISVDGRRTVLPMRYQCRPAGSPALFDRKFPGTYNARRDNLRGFWRGLYGRSHAIMVASAFYENVSRHAMEHRELAPGESAQNVVLEFRPQPRHDMLVACVWSRWSAPGERDLLSFAAITDEPPPEIAAAGHDRCIIPIRPEHIDAWLNPDPRNLRALDAMLDDRDRPYYEHRLAA